MKRYKKYENNKEKSENEILIEQCKNIVNILVSKTPLSTKEVYWVLAIRLKIKPEELVLKTFDELMLNKALKQLKLMLEISVEE